MIMLLDASIRGTMLNKFATIVKALVENMVCNEYRALFDRDVKRRGNRSFDAQRYFHRFQLKEGQRI